MLRRRRRLPGPLSQLGAQLAANFAQLHRREPLQRPRPRAWPGVDIDPDPRHLGPSDVKDLMARSILAKDTHGSTVRFAPPLVASDEDIAGLVAAVTEILTGA